MNSVLDILNFFLPYTPFFFMCYMGGFGLFFPPFFGGCVALLEGLSIQKDTNHQRNEARKGKKERGVKMEVSSLF